MLSRRNYRPMVWRFMLALACTLLLGVSSLETLFAPKKDPWPRWEKHDPASGFQVDHSGWDELLKQHLRLGKDGISRFDYAGLNMKSRNRLDAYLDLLSKTRVSALDRAEQLAYWINLYNALTVRTVAEAYPVKSIRDIDISPGLFADGPWGKTLIEVEEQPLNLNDIEHRILRPLWEDPRVHYALNCASLGCPNLAERAYRAAAMDEMLDTGARDYVNSTRGIWWEGNRLGVSSIYVWFKVDFGDNDAGILEHLSRYADPDLARRLQGVKRIDDHGYDWELNDAS